jgi:transposase
MRLRDELGVLYADEDFASLFPTVGQPAETPWRLALVVVMQFLENLTDRQAADAVHGRIDWKYALSLELTDPGFDFSVLSEFRARLVAAAAEHVLLDRLLSRCQERGWLKARGRQRTDSTHILAAIQRLNRLEWVGQALQQALNELALLAPTWLKTHAPGAWWERYARKREDSRFPRSETERRQWAEQIGQDGVLVLALVEQAETPVAVRECESVARLRLIWSQQYHFPPQDDQALRWRENAELPAASERLVSPHDPEARFSVKRDWSWVTCPQGKVNSFWRDQTGVRGNPVIEVQFRKADCGPCAAGACCTGSRTAGRTLTLLARAHFETIQAARAWQETEEFQQLYHHRAGIEGTVSQAVAALAMRRTRYRGQAKTRLQHIATAVAINFGRLWAWLNGVSRAQTRVSAFAALAP